MAKSITLFLGLLFTTLLLAGCAAEPPKPPPPKPRDIFKEQMLEAAGRASQSQRILAESSNAVTVDTLSPAKREQIAWQSGFVPPGMELEITLGWNGPVLPLMEVLSKQSGYKLHINGQRPVTDLIVSLDRKSRKIVQVIRDVGTQLGVAGRIEVIPDFKVIELHYSATPDGLAKK